MKSRQVTKGKGPRAPHRTPNRPTAPLTGQIEPPRTGPAFNPSQVEMQRRMRFNPLRAISPESLSLAHDNFDVGYLWQAALYWDAMIRRDDTLSFVVPQLENSIAAKPWAVFKKKGADEKEAARHAAALEYFYANVTAVDAFDRNLRGDRHLLLKQMGGSYAFRYAVHHFVWQREPGKMIEVEGAAPVPALTAEMEFVPLWYFENTSGQLRLLRYGGFGGIGEELDWDGEWMVTSGQGLMFAAAGCYIFKRLAFQDWTIFNERYAQQKVIGMTNAQADSEPGRRMVEIVGNFNGDEGIVLHECQATDKPPISLLGPEGTVSVDLFERFLDRQDEKMTVMFRGSGQANITAEKKDTGITAQIKETEALELAHCAAIASACRTFIDRAVIKYCFGEDVEPLAYFGLPDMDEEDARQLRESAGFLADRGGRVDLLSVADRLGVPLADQSAEEEDVLHSVSNAPATDPSEKPKAGSQKTANARELARLQELVEEALRTGNTFDPSEARDRQGKWTATEAASLKDFLFKMNSDPGAHLQARIGEINRDTARRIRKAIGQEPRELWIHSDEFRHVQRLHPEIGSADWHGLSGMVNSADFIRASLTGGGERAVEIWKKAQGWKLVVGTGRRGTGRLYVRTFKQRGEPK